MSYAVAEQLLYGFAAVARVVTRVVMRCAITNKERGLR